MRPIESSESDQASESECFSDNKALAAIDLVKPFTLAAFGAVFGTIAPTPVSTWNCAEKILILGFTAGVLLISVVEVWIKHFK